MATLSFNTLKKTDVTWLPLIPEHWELIKVRHLFKESTKKGFPNEPLLVASQKHGVVSKDAYGKRTVEATKDLHNLKLVEVGDYVISLRSFQGGIELAYERGIISPAYTVMKETKIIDRRYFKNLFKSPPFISLMTLCVKGIREGQNIDYPTFKNEYLPFPPIGEQKAIAEYLDKKNNEIDKFIRNKEKLIELLGEERKAKLFNAVTKGINVIDGYKSSSINWLPVIPGKWNVKRLKHTVVKISGGITPSMDNANFWGGNVPWVTSKDMKSDIITASEMGITKKALQQTSIKMIPANSILLVVRSGILQHSLPASLNGIPITINQDLKAITVNKKLFLPAYFRMLLKGIEANILHECRKAVATVESIEMSDFTNFYLPVPPLEEQQKIIEYISQIFNDIDLAISKAQQEITAIKEYREALITDLVTGKRRIPQ